MSITFIIKQGYRSESNSNLKDGELLEIARSIDLIDVKDLAIEWGFVETHKNSLIDYIMPYSKIPSEDLTIQFENNELHQTASGSGVERSNKEIIRKVFSFLVIKEAMCRGRTVDLITV